MATEEFLQCSVASVVEEVLQQHGKRLCDIDLASRKAEEASLRRHEAAGWLRKTVGVVAGKDLPAEPSEEDFRLGLRSGIILCHVLNKVQPGAVPKVIEAPPDSGVIPDGAALSAYQYFENVRNFLVAVDEMRIPTFEASDLEKGGKASRIVNCVLALKSYNDWKLSGGSGLWKYAGNQKPSSSIKQFVRKNAELFINSISRNSLTREKSLDSLLSEESAFGDLGDSDSCSLSMLVHQLLLDKKEEDIPIIVGNMLSKVMEAFEQQLACRKEQLKMSPDESVVSEKSPAGIVTMMDNNATSKEVGEECNNKKDIQNPQPEGQAVRQQMLAEQHQRDIQELKNILHTAKADMHVLQMKHQEEVIRLGKHLHGLANAASGYQKVLEENRKLYNQVQDLKGNIRVYCRVRPFLPGHPNSLSTVYQMDGGNITIITPSKYGKEGRKTFTFNKVFGPSATQGEVFADTQPLIRSVLDGYNVCIFAYGQTGSGKTYTMTGPQDLTKESIGVNYRALSDLFVISEQRKDIVCYDVSVQMIEIYNEQVRDLLVTDGVNRRLEIRNSSQKGVNVPDANMVPVTSTSDVINLMNLGQKNRAVGSTAMNDRSSRSHSCLTVHVQGRDLTSGAILRGCMHLVDLAGSERVDKSEVVGERLKEAQHINKSLSALGDVIASLAQKNSHVPYRNSKLTQLLQDSLGGQAKTLMFVHMSPEPDAIGESISTLKFAERVSTVELGAARANKEGSEIRELKEQIVTLKAALARKDGETGRLQHSKSFTPERSRMKSSRSSSSSNSSWQYQDVLGDHRQPMEDDDSIEVLSNPMESMRRQTLDPQVLLVNSIPWPPIGGDGPKDTDRDAVSGNWEDKVMLNKHDATIGDHSPGRWEEDCGLLPQMFYQKSTPDTSKVHSDHHSNKVLDDSDYLDAATSDSSEADFLCRTNIPRLSSLPTDSGSRTKKPSPTPAKSPELRSFIPTPQARRLSTGTSLPLQKARRHPVSADGKRKPSSGR